jgi:hypothetical protein
MVPPSFIPVPWRVILVVVAGDAELSIVGLCPPDSLQSPGEDMGTNK